MSEKLYYYVYVAVIDGKEESGLYGSRAELATARSQLRKMLTKENPNAKIGFKVFEPFPF